MGFSGFNGAEKVLTFDSVIWVGTLVYVVWLDMKDLQV